VNQREHLLEQLWILRYQMGDNDALVLLVERYCGPLLYYVRRLIGDSHAAEDVLQDVWMTVVRELPRLRDRRSFAAWVYRIARNKVFRQLKRKGHLPIPTEDMEVEADAKEEGHFSPEEAALVHQCLESLPFQHREVLMLRFFEQMSYEQIAEVVGCRVGTVRSRLHYAKRALRKEIEEKSNGKR